MKQNEDSKEAKQDATINLIKRLTAKQLTEEQYRTDTRFGNAQKRRLNDFYKKEGVNKNG